jgi:hypothetical protein
MVMTFPLKPSEGNNPTTKFGLHNYERINFCWKKPFSFMVIVYDSPKKLILYKIWIGGALFYLLQMQTFYQR